MGYPSAVRAAEKLYIELGDAPMPEPVQKCGQYWWGANESAGITRAAGADHCSDGGAIACSRALLKRAGGITSCQLIAAALRHSRCTRAARRPKLERRDRTIFDHHPSEPQISLFLFEKLDSLYRAEQNRRGRTGEMGYAGRKSHGEHLRDGILLGWKFETGRRNEPGNYFPRPRTAAASFKSRRSTNKVSYCKFAQL